jgi:hypothetical protein
MSMILAVEKLVMNCLNHPYSKSIIKMPKEPFSFRHFLYFIIRY